MGTFDAVLSETESRFGISESKATTLLSGLLGFLKPPGALSELLDRFRRIGLGDTVSSWLGGGSKPISSDNIEAALGSDTINSLASRAGLTAGTASAALAFVIPKLVQRLAPGGVVPTHLPSDLSSYISGAGATVDSAAREAASYTTERVGDRGLARILWPILGLIALLLLFGWIWRSREGVTRTAFNAADQVRLAKEKANAALSALKPGFSGSDLVQALNLQIINFAPGSSQIPADSYDLLDRAAAAMKAAPQGMQVEIAGHTDTEGSAAANLELSQARADAVRDYLINHGVSPSALMAKGYGDTKPVAANDTEEGKFRNRRIEFVAVR